MARFFYTPAIATESVRLRTTVFVAFLLLLAHFGNANDESETTTSEASSTTGSSLVSADGGGNSTIADNGTYTLALVLFLLSLILTLALLAAVVFVLFFVRLRLYHRYERLHRATLAVSEHVGHRMIPPLAEARFAECLGLSKEDLDKERDDYLRAQYERPPKDLVKSAKKSAKTNLAKGSVETTAFDSEAEAESKAKGKKSNKTTANATTRDESKNVSKVSERNKMTSDGTDEKRIEQEEGYEPVDLSRGKRNTDTALKTISGFGGPQSITKNQQQQQQGAINPSPWTAQQPGPKPPQQNVMRP